MPLLGYSMFEGKILDGSKRQTIRKLRKRPIEKGDMLYQYWHLRRKDCEELGVSQCRETFFISISGWPGCWRIDRHEKPSIFSGRTLLDREALDLARRDGFSSVDEMVSTLMELNKGDLDHTQIWQVIRW